MADSSVGSIPLPKTSRADALYNVPVSTCRKPSRSQGSLLLYACPCRTVDGDIAFHLAEDIPFPSGAFS